MHKLRMHKRSGIDSKQDAVWHPRRRSLPGRTKKGITKEVMFEPGLEKADKNWQVTLGRGVARRRLGRRSTCRE